MGEVMVIYQAQLSRAHAVEGWNPVKKIKTFAPIAFPLVFIAIEKADRLGLSMELRGYGSGRRTYYKKLRFTSLDWVFLILMFLLLCVTLWMRIHGIGRITVG